MYGIIFKNIFILVGGKQFVKVVAQIIGIVAMVFNICSYQQKQQRGIIALQLFGSVLFTVHFFMLNAYMGGLLNAIGVIRAIVFLYKDKLKTEHVLWLIGFIAIYVASYILTFTVFNKQFDIWNAMIEILPLIGMTATTFAFRSRTPKVTRLLGLVSSPSWLVYNLISLSIGAIFCEVISLGSILVGYLRLDREKMKKGDQNA